MVNVVLVTEGRLVKGSVKVPTEGRLSEKLNEDSHFLPVFEWPAQEEPTLVNKDRIALVYEIDDLDKPAVSDLVVAKIGCAVQITIDGFAIEGVVKLATDVSLEGLLTNLRSRFIPVIDASVRATGEEPKSCPIVIVNRTAIVTMARSPVTN